MVALTACDAMGRTRLFARLGVARAQFELGLAFEQGRGERQSDVEAAAWYLEAAEQGQLDARFRLALMYVEGRGVERSLHEAERLLNGLVAMGDPRAIALRQQVRAEIIAEAQAGDLPAPGISL